MFITQSFRRAVQVGGSRTATVDGVDRRTWNEVGRRVRSLAKGLSDLGVHSGDRVAVLSLNSARYLEAYYAIFWLGAACVPLNARWSVDELAYGLTDSEPTILLCDDAHFEIASQLRQRCPGVRHLILMADRPSPGGGVLAYEALAGAGHDIDAPVVPGETMAMICYTGGTTGRSKGVMLSHLNLWSSAIAFGNDIRDLTRDTSRTLNVMPLFHSGGVLPVLTTVIGAGCNVFLPSFLPQTFLQTLEDEKITHTSIVPTMVRMILDSIGERKRDLSALKVMVYGAAPMSQAQAEEAMEKLPGVDLQHGYGQTELAPYVSTLRPEYHVLNGPGSGKLRSIGKVGYCSEAYIADSDGKELPRGEVGELRVRGPHVMLGYWRKPKETAATIDNGWIRTGDAGYMDEEGFVFLIDRLKDMIVSGGENIYSSEVENALATHPAIATAVVIGIPNERWGEAVHAVVMLREGHQATAEEIINHCHGLIAGYKCPRSLEFRSDPFPVSGAGKILKRELRMPYWAGRNSALV
ncbi:long-chain-fatty-acid--CoA ligase [Bradyrhizobium sp. AS23.2]|uniref:long-chain-fatty-acid--CoA ligase n=1 Tax=Bradyrhizobium sp. AS23.2 TaxID=1680155 RepID=UPI00093CEF84|nr:long-chain-fatty-acid--CoA ligase [Bradyrhizobium sp. AS23.2]OKO84556.1 hypothetical protein AC630_08570 [Bradyrhizobium sp. AS23.2]